MQQERIDLAARELTDQRRSPSRGERAPRVNLELAPQSSLFACERPVELRWAAVSAAAQVVPGFIANEEADTVSLARRRAADAREAVRTARMLANDVAVTAERTHC